MRQNVLSLSSGRETVYVLQSRTKICRWDYLGEFQVLNNSCNIFSIYHIHNSSSESSVWCPPEIGNFSFSPFGLTSAVVKKSVIPITKNYCSTYRTPKMFYLQSIHSTILLFAIMDRSHEYEFPSNNLILEAFHLPLTLSSISGSGTLWLSDSGSWRLSRSLWASDGSRVELGFKTTITGWLLTTSVFLGVDDSSSMSSSEATYDMPNRCSWVSPGQNPCHT